MKQLKLTVLLVGAFVLSACNLVTVEEEKQLSLASEGIELLSLDLDEGDVEVIGESAREQIDVIALVTAVAETEEEAIDFKDVNTEITLENEDGTAYLRTRVNSRSDTATEARIHVTVFVPETLDIDMKKDAGYSEMSNIAGHVAINDGVGDISLREVTGDVTITDGEGAIDIQQVSGHMTIHTNQGRLTIEEVTGDLTIIAGSGDVYVRAVDGSVSVRSGAGDIDIDDVSHDVKILENSNGEVRIENIEGSVIENE
ncbi:DUF4097 family beta strand repeat-containing protein [Desertibacillus haloalkaliphilus]|uniref:DUF4097 family beta strand repeat-containing protein n=1 Tax=Desertibacillus haloalkaliphilus TaxID=1328930 RepID=UPI001C2616C6|nr:DUF4097 family beta strand repeat-containing protein [Desertibacillus haloalkaliphilus]MBU8907787.1 DUF4097 family beta strand repeat protein [Desertibacillus haloalkaliphilus]